MNNDREKENVLNNFTKPVKAFIAFSLKFKVFVNASVLLFVWRLFVFSHDEDLEKHP